VDPARDQHGQHPVAAVDRALDDVAVVGRPRDDRDAALERVELAHAGFTAHGDHLVAAGQRLLDHVLPELSGRPDDADPPPGGVMGWFHLFTPGVRAR
jgi:hypothetical protein